MSKKILVVVDVQKDFYHPDGALYVKGGEYLPERIAKVIPEFDDVIFTVDWHPYNHCSFKENGGIWPVHCVAYTEGASLPKEFMPYFKEIHNDRCFNIVMKGMDNQKEEYGANPNMIMYSHNENPEECEFVFCGIALSHCVKETVANFIEKFPLVKCYVWIDGGVSIDDGTIIRKFMEENNIGEWKPED